MTRAPRTRIPFLSASRTKRQSTLTLPTTLRSDGDEHQRHYDGGEPSFDDGDDDDDDE